MKLSDFIEKTTDFFGKTASWLAIPLMFVLCYEVIIRRLVSPTIWAFDISYMLYGAHFMLVTAFALKYKAHVRTDILYRRVSARIQGILDSFLYFVIFLPGIGLLFWVSYSYFLRSWTITERAMTSPWMPPIWPLKMIMFISIGLLLLQGISELIRAMYAARYNKWPEEQVLIAVDVPIEEEIKQEISQEDSQEVSQEDNQENSQEDNQEVNQEDNQENEEDQDDSQKRGES
jgi:TRAP-type mannitol/chloroaromatic compound transport system permease small subunit